MQAPPARNRPNAPAEAPELGPARRSHKLQLENGGRLACQAASTEAAIPRNLAERSRERFGVPALERADRGRPLGDLERAAGVRDERRHVRRERLEDDEAERLVVIEVKEQVRFGQRCRDRRHEPRKANVRMRLRPLGEVVVQRTVAADGERHVCERRMPVQGLKDQLELLGRHEPRDHGDIPDAVT